MKRIVCLLLVVLIMLSFSGCNSLVTAFQSVFFLSMVIASDDSVSKEDVIEFVNEHKDELEECAKKKDFSEFEGIGIVKNVYNSGAYTEFYCGGKGLAAGSSYYCGFFYSPRDSVTAMWEGLPVNSVGDGFVYEEADGDNIFYSEKISDCFFFYEESY